MMFLFQAVFIGGSARSKLAFNHRY